MNWKFWQKSAPAPKREPRVRYIPAEYVQQIRALWDAYAIAPEDGDKEARYHLWRRIKEFCPETEQGHWRVDFSNALQVKLIEDIED